MIVIVGESGAGKSTLQNAFIKKHPQYSKIVTYTTRPSRDNEREGIDYHFVSSKDYHELKDNGFFAETNKYRGWEYGTPINECNDNHKVAVLTPAGMRNLRSKEIPIISVYLCVDRRSRLIKLLQRGDSVDEAYRRNLADVGQFDGIKDEVQHVLYNPNYDIDVDELANELYKLLHPSFTED